MKVKLKSKHASLAYAETQLLIYLAIRQQSCWATRSDTCRCSRIVGDNVLRQRRDQLETLHNDEAPSQQNAVCKGRSAWEVMRDHEDFAGG